MTISDYYSLSQSAQSHRDCDKLQSRVLTNKKTQRPQPAPLNAFFCLFNWGVSAVNITLTKIVTDLAKSVKIEVEIAAGN